MPDGFLQRFPDLTAVLQISGGVEVGINGVLEDFGSIDPGQPASPLAAIVTALTELEGTLNIDTGGLSTRLPAAITTIHNALPTGALEYVESIENAYTAAQDFLADTPLARAVPSGSTLQQAALAVIE